MRSLYPFLVPLLLTGCVEYSQVRLEGIDTFLQNSAESVDILLVVDNSGSMQPYQQKLGDNFDGFLTYFIEADVDYQIAAVTTDGAAKDSGQILDNVITPATKDAAAVFNRMVNVGTNGSGYEMGIEVAYRALSEPLISVQNAGFLRPEASLSILFVSDEEDASPRPINDYINDFRAIKGARDSEGFNASALVVTDERLCTTQQASYSVPSVRYPDIAKQTLGVLGNLCAEDFGRIVTDLSLNASRLEDTFFLSEEPDVPSLQVFIDDEEIPCDSGRFTFQRLEDPEDPDAGEKPALVFERNDLPPAGSRLDIRYNFGSGDAAEFCTGADAASEAE